MPTTCTLWAPNPERGTRTDVLNVPFGLVVAKPTVTRSVASKTIFTFVPARKPLPASLTCCPGAALVGADTLGVADMASGVGPVGAVLGLPDVGRVVLPELERPLLGAMALLVGPVAPGASVLRGVGKVVVVVVGSPKVPGGGTSTSPGPEITVFAEGNTTVVDVAVTLGPDVVAVLSGDVVDVVLPGSVLAGAVLAGTVLEAPLVGGVLEGAVVVTAPDGEEVEVLLAGEVVLVATGADEGEVAVMVVVLVELVGQGVVVLAADVGGRGRAAAVVVVLVGRLVAVVPVAPVLALATDGGALAPVFGPL